MPPAFSLTRLHQAGDWRRAPLVTQYQIATKIRRGSGQAAPLHEQRHVARLGLVPRPSHAWHAAGFQETVCCNLETSCDARYAFMYLIRNRPVSPQKDVWGHKRLLDPARTHAIRDCRVSLYVSLRPRPPPSPSLLLNPPPSVTEATMLLGQSYTRSLLYTNVVLTANGRQHASARLCGSSALRAQSAGARHQSAPACGGKKKCAELKTIQSVSEPQGVLKGIIYFMAIKKGPCRCFLRYICSAIRTWVLNIILHPLFEAKGMKHMSTTLPAYRHSVCIQNFQTYGTNLEYLVITQKIAPHLGSAGINFE